MLSLPYLCAKNSINRKESMKFPITNNYDPHEKRPKAKIESMFIYRPEREWTYSHHQSITYYKGRLCAIWANGRVNEDDVGQRVLMATADDFDSWTEPKPLVDSTVGDHSKLVLTAAGFHHYEGTLTAYIGRYEYRSDYLNGGKRKRGDMGHQDTGLSAVTTSSTSSPSRSPKVTAYGPAPTS